MLSCLNVDKYTCKSLAISSSHHYTLISCTVRMNSTSDSDGVCCVCSIFRSGHCNFSISYWRGHWKNKCTYIIILLWCAILAVYQLSWYNFQYHDNDIKNAHNSLISSYSGSLGVPRPNLLIAVTMTVMLPTNTPSGSDGAVNVSVVVELLTFIIVPL